MSSFWFHRVQFHHFDLNFECFGTGMYYTCRSCRQRCIKSKLMVAPMAFHLNSASRANPPNRDSIIDWVEKDAVDLGGWERVAIGRHNPSYLRRICSVLTSSACTPPPTYNGYKTPGHKTPNHSTYRRIVVRCPFLLFRNRLLTTVPPLPSSISDI